MKLIDLFEARRNPEANARRSVISQLRDHSGKGRYVSFTQSLGTRRFGDIRSKMQTKLGVNPSTYFGTPAGIYAYPVDYVISYYARHGEYAPFTGYEPWRYAYIVESATPHHIDKDTDFAPYAKALNEIREDMGMPRVKAQKLSTFLQGTKQVASELVGATESITARWNGILRKCGVEAISDEDGLIYHEEPTQTVFLSKPALRIIDAIVSFED